MHDLFAPEVVHDLYSYVGCLQAEEPMHWHARDKVWLIIRYDDGVWLTRHPELFSSAVFTPSATVSAQSRQALGATASALGLKARSPRLRRRRAASLRAALPSRVASADIQQVFAAMFIRRDRPTHTAILEDSIELVHSKRKHAPS
jgi:hypothetical protein